MEKYFKITESRQIADNLSKQIYKNKTKKVIFSLLVLRK